MPDTELVAQSKELIRELPTAGWRRVHALLRRQAKADGTLLPDHKRVYRLMREHDLLLQRYTGLDEDRRYERRVVVDRSNLRWCPTASRSAATMARSCASPLRSTAAAERLWASSPPPKASRARMSRTS